MSILTPEERIQASELGQHLVKSLTSVNALVAGFALQAVFRAMPRPVRDAMTVAETAIKWALAAEKRKAAEDPPREKAPDMHDYH